MAVMRQARVIGAVVMRILQGSAKPAKLLSCSPPHLSHPAVGLGMSEPLEPIISRCHDSASAIELSMPRI